VQEHFVQQKLNKILTVIKAKYTMRYKKKYMYRSLTDWKQPVTGKLNVT